MTVNTKHVIGLPIYSIDEGKNIHTVEDVIYDPSAQRIQALVVSSGGIFSEGKAIRIDDLKSIGEDAVIIQSESLLRKTSELEAASKHIASDDTYLTKSNVMTEEGKDLGKVVDLLFDTQTGNVEELEISQGGIRDLHTGRKRVKPSNIVTVGEDALIVSAFTEVAFDAQADRGGIHGMWNNAKQSTQEMTDQMKEAWHSPETQQKINRAREEIGSAAESAKSSLQQTAERAKSEFDQVKDDPDNKQIAHDAKSHLKESVHEFKEKSTHVADQAAQTFDQKKYELGKKQEDKTVGQYITRNILDQHDHVIARRGEMVTHQTLDKAKNAGMLDTIIGNVSLQPVSYSSGSLGGEVEYDEDHEEKHATNNDSIRGDV